MKQPQKIKRRELLKSSASGLAAISALTAGSPHARIALPRTYANERSPSEKIVVGCIGTGDLGCRWHLKENLLKRLKDRVQVAAVCDVDAKHLNAAVRACLEASAPEILNRYCDFKVIIFAGRSI